ncbi:hypothetical protein JCM14469_23750 [Desulfatiferula olefinivorans]
MSFLTENIRLILHLRQRLHRDNMLGLCLGAGVSTDFQFPTWVELIKRIAENEKIQGTRLLEVSQSLTSQAQFLFQKYKQSLEAHGKSGDDVVDYRRASFGFLDIVHKCLYRDAIVEDLELQAHPYLWDLLPLIKQSTMTVNYNFDDSIERMLYLFNEQVEPGVDDKGFEVVWLPSTQFRRNRGVIYHPNGFLPLRKTDGFSDNIVFLEQEYADQLIDVGGGHYSCLLNHMSKTTLLFLGLSLHDTTLKHLLRISARNAPGSFHYYIHWCNEGKPSIEEQKAIVDANFSIYNLVTLFLTTEQIKALVKYVMMDQDTFDSQCDDEPKGVNTIFRYYITGAVGSGKTTAIEQIRSIDSYDEWVDRKHPLLPKPHQELSPDQRSGIDIWINQQFRKKNRRISKASHGISVIDRSPLDPLYFIAESSSCSKRAGELIAAMVPENSPIKEIAPGHLIVLICNESVLKTRLANRHKTYTSELLEQQQNILKDFWKDSETTVIDTTNLTIREMVGRILSEILFAEYRELNFQLICKSLQDCTL